jgi:hypothetical protein
LIVCFVGGDAECGDGVAKVAGEEVFEMPDGIEVEDGEFAEEEMIDSDVAWFKVGGMGFPRTQVRWVSKVDLVEDGQDLCTLDACPCGPCLTEADTIVDEVSTRKRVPEQPGASPPRGFGAPIPSRDDDGAGPVAVLDELG